MVLTHWNFEDLKTRILAGFMDTLNFLGTYTT
jgi:hypothetical protein